MMMKGKLQKWSSSNISSKVQYCLAYCRLKRIEIMVNMYFIPWRHFKQSVWTSLIKKSDGAPTYVSWTGYPPRQCLGPPLILYNGVTRVQENIIFQEEYSTMQFVSTDWFYCDAILNARRYTVPRRRPDPMPRSLPRQMSQITSRRSLFVADFSKFVKLAAPEVRMRSAEVVYGLQWNARILWGCFFAKCKVAPTGLERRATEMSSPKVEAN